MEETEEKKLILGRFLVNDRHLYHIGKTENIPFFDQFDKRASESGSPEFSQSERKAAIEELVSVLNDRAFVESVNRIVRGETVYPDVEEFIGEHFFCNLSSGLRMENRQLSLADNIRTAVRNTDGRIIPFLRAIVELYREDHEGVYEGFCLNDIMKKLNSYGIKSVPDPVDLVFAKSYNFYYQVGGQKCPVHVIPEEMIPVVESVLAEYRQ